MAEVEKGLPTLPALGRAMKLRDQMNEELKMLEEFSRLQSALAPDSGKWGSPIERALL